MATALRRTAEETATCLLKTFVTSQGAFVAAFDADTEGEEGLTYVFSHAEVCEIVASVGHDVQRFVRFLGVEEQGNWEGTNVLHEPVPRERFARDEALDPQDFAAAWDEVRSALRARRNARPQPGVDDKVLTDWNALAIRGLVAAARDPWAGRRWACARAPRLDRRRHTRCGRAP